MLLLALLQNVSLDRLLQVENARNRRVSSTSVDPDSNADNLRVPSGETRTLAEIQGPGVITHIWLTFPEAAPNWLAERGGARPDEIVLRMYWDGAGAPAVESPVGDFFAQGFGERKEVRSGVVQVIGGDSYNCFWPMPFHESARITLSNESDKPLNSTYFQIDYEERTLAPGTPYFCAQYHQEFPAESSSYYTVLEAEGTGHYVGTVLNVRTRSPYWFGEGDDVFFIDGESEPSLRGTGTEDYFLAAWGLEPYSFPWAGCPLVNADFGHIGMKISSYRWHVPDPVRFQRSLSVRFEHRGWLPPDERIDGKAYHNNERYDDFSSVAFWYQIGQPRRFTSLPPAAARVPPNLDWIVEGKDLLAGAQAGGGPAELQAGYPWTGAGQVFFHAGDAGATLELSFPVPREEFRALILPLTRSYDYGTYRILLDGVERVARIDLYGAEVTLREIDLGSQKLAPGTHTLRFECLGRNPLSSGHFLGLDSVRLRQRLAPR
ncbi:MAG: DUF2961 domain-containing protein [Planctomycetota bacterium]|nr:MAG: DUF2961 domain-containing protein [Planctomycetota bacterium]